MAKYPNNAHYLGEPSKSTSEAIAGSLLRKNYSGIIHGQAVECPAPPQARECPGP